MLAAHPVELEGLSPELRLANESGRAEAIGALRVACACAGVGLTAAGAGAARAIALHRPLSVVWIGSYGRFASGASGEPPFEPSEARVVERVKLIDTAVAQGKAAFPAPMPIELPLDRSLTAALERQGAKRLAALGTTLSITTDDEHARLLGEHSGCEGENLEALAVAQACASESVPCAILVACTNLVGSEGRAAWRANHTAAAIATGLVLDSWLRAR